jgi:hypothetical protein
VWRLRTARAITATAAVVVVAGWALSTGSSYSLVSHFVHMRATTAVSTEMPEVGVLVNAPSSELPVLASALSNYGLHASFAIGQPGAATDQAVLNYGDQALPRLPTHGLVRWMGTSDQLHDVLNQMGFGRHFLYVSNGPSVGQWWLAHHAGGRLVAGAVQLNDRDDVLGHLHAGLVIELTVRHAGDALPLLRRLSDGLTAQGLRAVTVSQLLHDAGASV